MMLKWWVIEGDDHEQKIVEAEFEESALDYAQEMFEEQYAEPYSRSILAVVDRFESEDSARGAYPSAE